MRRWLLLLLAGLGLSNTGCLIHCYSSDPSRRCRELLSQPDELRKIQDEWERYWFTDHPAHLTAKRVESASQFRVAPARREPARPLALARAVADWWKQGSAKRWERRLNRLGSRGIYTPVPITPWVTERMEEKYCYKNDSRTPVMPPIKEGFPPPVCENPPDEAAVLRALPQLPQGLAPFCEVSREDPQVVTELMVDKIDPPRFFPLIGPA
jgi:hypothetical protein